ncbi:ABC transporter permease [Citricoccus sp. NR2]|uniref:ABC transporter permease n=1 Tax=Citricoccus sp. NR2 TaxID=3004095 RepID=UPI0022DE565E|nr:ABC transporter permease [Citricoccus sp. NR2]WBL19324.1 ABC transporter permease [Citricoccus sp. NR2]
MSTLQTSTPRSTTPHGTGSAPVRGRTPFWTAVLVIAKREITSRLKSKGFVTPTLIMLAVILLGSVLGPRLGDMFSSTDQVAVTAESESTITALGEDFETVSFSGVDEAREAVADGEVDYAVVPDEANPTGLQVIADREAPSGVMNMLSVSPEVEILDPDAPNPMIVYFIGIGFGLVFFFPAITFGMTIAQSVVEEKQSRIVEILLATVPARAILSGKVLACSVLAFAQVTLYAAAAIIGLMLNGQQLNLEGLTAPIIWFVVLFTLAFISLAALYGAAASLVSRQEDLSAASSPIMMLIMLPYFLIIAFSNNETVLAVMSYIPFSAPVAVPMRVYLDSSAMWENIVAVGIVAVTAVLAIMLASLIYERSVLKMGAAVKWSQALKK